MTSTRTLLDDGGQDLHRFLAAYRELFPHDVLTLRESVSRDQDVSAAGVGAGGAGAASGA